MSRARVVAAIAALLTALLLQATLLGPLAAPAPASLPALLVAAVALVDGPGTGIPLGFAAGLIADLGSDHPAGILALSWMLVGLVAGLARSYPTPSSVRRDGAVAAVVCGLGSVVAGLLLTVTGSGGTSLGEVFRLAVPATLLDALVGLVVVALVRTFLRSASLRRPAPVLLLGDPR